MATTASDDAVEDIDGPTAYLERNADVVDIEAVRENDSESWKRALDESSQADVEDLDELGRFVVQLPDGSSAHDVLLVKDAGENLVGACDCKGWTMHGDACAHLCTLAQRDVLDDIIQRNNKVAEHLLDVREDDPDVDVVEHAPDRDDQEDAVDGDPVEDPVDDGEAQDGATGTPAKPVEAVEPQGKDAEDLPANDDSDPFAGKLPDLPDHLVMEMDGEPYIRRAGYARLAKAEGFRLDLREVVGAHQTDWKRAKYHARVEDESGNVVASDVGSAHLDVEDMANAEANLDELAATRAACRALAWATGEGLTAVEEVAAEAAQRAR